MHVQLDIQATETKSCFATYRSDVLLLLFGNFLEMGEHYGGLIDSLEYAILRQLSCPFPDDSVRSGYSRNVATGC